MPHINTDHDHLEERARDAMFVEELEFEKCDCGNCNSETPMFHHSTCCGVPFLIAFTYKNVLFLNCMLCGKPVQQYAIASKVPEVICQN